MANKYAGPCKACGANVPAGQGILEYNHGRGTRWNLWCVSCFNKSDNSGPEDRECGNRAYEDRCARAVSDGGEIYGGDYEDVF